MEVKTVPTKPIAGQKPGTSGLRKKTSVFMQSPYLENFLQCIFDVLAEQGSAYNGCNILVGGDGRYYNKEAIQKIIKIAAANGVGKISVAIDGVASTPAMSHLIRKRQAYGGILLTASHNPGGLHEDFGVKYNCSNGGPAPEKVTDLIYTKSTTISQYRVADVPDVDISKVGMHSFFNGKFHVEVFNAIDDYVDLMKSFFDFSAISAFLKRPDVSVRFDSLNGVTGPYSKRIFVEELGASMSSINNFVPLEDFGGMHPDPNMVHCAHLWEAVNKEKLTFASAWDGDGDRHIIFGEKFFVSPSDGIAILAAHAASCFPYFRTHKLHGVARSMPTSCALDRVAAGLKLPMYETPTGWKYFGNLFDDSRISICGEESFGSGCEIIREKDGIWATLGWLSILAYYNKNANDKLVGVSDIVKNHWKKYGRDLYARYDFENVSSDKADLMMDKLRAIIKGGANELNNYTTPLKMTVIKEFAYDDPVDRSKTEKQGIIMSFASGERVVIRLSGTGSSGATIRVYVEKHVDVTSNSAILDAEAHDVLHEAFKAAMLVTKIPELTGKSKPDVST